MAFAFCLFLVSLGTSIVVIQFPFPQDVGILMLVYGFAIGLTYSIERKKR